jgi:hypothetical protein
VWPAGTYENVKVVWTGKGSYATAGGCKNVLPPGVTLTTDKSVWDNAKSAWLAGSSTSGTTSSTTVSPTSTTTTSGSRATTATASVPTAVTAKAKGHRVSGTLGTASGDRIAGARLTLQRRTGTSGWVKVTSRRTGDTGAVRTTVAPWRTTYYRWSYKGSTAHPAAHSRSVRVTR